MRPAFHRSIYPILVMSTALICAFRFSDDEFINRLIDQVQKYQQQRPIEKVYVHTDREVYLTGETIWMKGYLVTGDTHAVDSVSGVLYVDLVDPLTRRVRLRAQLRATAGYAPGQLSLPDSLAAGTYQLRAYTNYMRNFPDDYFFTRTITILRPDGLASAGSAGPTTVRPDVQFLPEGGQLVEGIDSRVAFKAVNATGRSVDVTGFVLDARKDTVIGFASTHLGMGYFALKPETGQTYTAFVRLGDGTVAPYPMPAAQAQGVVMQVDNLTNKDNVRVYVYHNKVSTDPAATMTLMAQTRGQIGPVAKISLTKKTNVVSLPRAGFPDGMTHLTLFDETNKPVCERLVFVDKNEQVAIALTADKAAYKKRERVELTITTTDAQGKPVAANLSVAAVDARLAPDLDSGRATITSHLLLSSDLTGTIEQPGYYFEQTASESQRKARTQQLDLLLMTQGWRRFTWTDVLAGTVPPAKYPIERGLSLTGRVVRPNQKDIGGKVNLTFMLMLRDSTRNMLMGETDEAGNYAAYDLDFTDTTTVLIQGVKGKANRDLTITLDQLLTPTVTITRVPYNPFEVRRDELAEFIRRTNEYLEIERQIRRNGEVLLQAVTVKAKKYVESDSRKIYGTADATVKFDQTNSAGRLTVLDVIQGRIAGVQVTGSGFNAKVQIRGAANFGGAIEPLFVLDGMPVDLQTINSISVQDVDQVDVLKGASAAIYGSRAAGGVIIVLTKRGSSNYDPSNQPPSPGTLVTKLPGYAPIREFYAPRYDVKKPEHIRPDYRTTLHWSPMIQTNAEGKATVSFFASDASTTLRLRVEGITPDGLPGMGQAVVRVE